MELSIIIPCCNEEKNIKEIIKKIREQIKKINYEIIFVDDGSTDGTLKEMKKEYKEYDNINIISFSKNYGQDYAILEGLKNSKAKYAVIIDADLQQDPKYIMDMYKILEEKNEYDIVAAYPKKRKENKIVSKFKKSFYKILNKRLEKNNENEAGRFRMFRSNVVVEITKFKEHFWFAKGIFNYIGFNTYYMEYEVKDRLYGKSKYSFNKLIKCGVSGIYDFTDIMVKLIRSIGIIIFIISVVYLLICIGKNIFGNLPIDRINIIIFALLFIGGLQIVLLSIIASYLYNTYIESKQRPSYIVKQRLYAKDK